MPRIMAIDYGTKRTGLAVTDPLQIIAQSLQTVPTTEVFEYLKKYLDQEEVELIVVGLPLYPDGNPAQIAPLVDEFVQKLQKEFPHIPVTRQDESFSSETAKAIILRSGVGRKKRSDKALVDKVSAAVILEKFMKDSGKWI